MTTTHEAIMTLADIEAQYGPTWVLLEDPIHDANDAVTGGTVLCISQNPEDLYHVLLTRRPKHSAFPHLGPTPANIFLNL